MFETLREELNYFEGAFRSIMTTKPMTEESLTVFQYAIDSIDYILKSQNWLDDKWVRVGFENIEKAKVLLKKMLADDDITEELCLSHAREVLSKTEGICPVHPSLLTKEESERIEQLREFTRNAIRQHNERVEHEHFAWHPSSIIGRGGGGMKSLYRTNGHHGSTTGRRGIEDGVAGNIGHEGSLLQRLELSDGQHGKGASGPICEDRTIGHRGRKGQGRGGH